jgi:hypothetical protein
MSLGHHRCGQGCGFDVAWVAAEVTAKEVPGAGPAELVEVGSACAATAAALEAQSGHAGEASIPTGPRGLRGCCCGAQVSTVAA